MELDIELVRKIAGEPFAQQFFIWTTSLALASFIHAGRVKKELKHITEALNGLSTALRRDLDNHSQRIDKVEVVVGKVEQRLDRIDDRFDILIQHNKPNPGGI